MIQWVEKIRLYYLQNRSQRIMSIYFREIHHENQTFYSQLTFKETANKFADSHWTMNSIKIGNAYNLYFQIYTMWRPWTYEQFMTCNLNYHRI